MENHGRQEQLLFDPPGAPPQRRLVKARAHARRTDPQTSHDAAASVTEISELQLEILKALKAKGPMRDDELVHYLKEDLSGPRILISESGIRSRRCELTVTDPPLVKQDRDQNGNARRTKLPGKKTRGIVWRAV